MKHGILSNKLCYSVTKSTASDGILCAFSLYVDLFMN